CMMFRALFFSSRRRHTRSKRDWSSDVCSSDLLAIPTSARMPDVTAISVSTPVTVNQPATVTVTGTNPCGAVRIDFGDAQVITFRSEERRVGKECRWWWVSSEYKNNDARRSRVQ